ncbi:MAG: hypothetical protein NTY20_03720 [Candidatus Aenigmarchaeota archaeon]|nr:hypothetical protein [Candidatus Aenigmarchaeota archaeon]
MKKKLLIILLVIIAFLAFGLPSRLNLGIFSWDFNGNKQQTNSPENDNVVYAKDAIIIENLTLTKSIYGQGENVTVYFKINDEFNLPYNFTVYWIHNNTRFNGWSTNNSSTQTFQAWYMVRENGNWKIQVDLYWFFENDTYTADKIAEFSVYPRRAEVVMMYSPGFRYIIENWL